VSVNSYSHDLQKTAHKRAPTKPPTAPASDPEDPSPYSYDLASVPSRNFLERVANYPPEHLELVAYNMASKKLPATTNRSKNRKTHSWSPRLQIPSTQKSSTASSHPSHRVIVEHSKAYDAAADTGHFAKNMLLTGIAAPVNFFYQLANGFHNAPSYLFHDDTVRRRDKITGLGSGLKVAAKGFTFNLFDGFTGIVTQPYLGYQKDGTVGIMKGIGKGMGGLVFKVAAAGTGIPGYGLKGVEKQLEKRLDRELKAKVLEIRLRQGLSAYKRASREEREEILERWREFGCQAAGL